MKVPAGRPSQGHGLVKDSVAHLPMERFLGPDVDLDLKQLLEISEWSSRLRPGSQATSTSRSLLSFGFITGHGTYHAQIVGAMLLG